MKSISNNITTQQIYVPNEVKALTILALSDNYGKGKGKLSEAEGYLFFAKKGIDLFNSFPEKYARFYRAWYHSPRKNLSMSADFWRSLTIFRDTEQNFRMSDVYVMMILIGLSETDENIAKFVENVLLSNDNLTAYRSSRNTKICLEQTN